MHWWGSSGWGPGGNPWPPTLPLLLAAASSFAEDQTSPAGFWPAPAGLLSSTRCWAPHGAVPLVPEPRHPDAVAGNLPPPRGRLSGLGRPAPVAGARRVPVHPAALASGLRRAMAGPLSLARADRGTEGPAGRSGEDRPGPGRRALRVLGRPGRPSEDGGTGGHCLRRRSSKLGRGRGDPGRPHPGSLVP